MPSNHPCLVAHCGQHWSLRAHVGILGISNRILLWFTSASCQELSIPFSKYWLTCHGGSTANPDQNVSLPPQCAVSQGGEKWLAGQFSVPECECDGCFGNIWSFKQWFQIQHYLCAHLILHFITCYEDCYLYIHSVWTASRQDQATFTTCIIKAIWQGLTPWWSDIMNAPELVLVGNDCCDATFVHVSVSPPYHDYLSHIMVSMRCSLIRMYGTQTDQWYLNQQFYLVNYKIFSWLAWFKASPALKFNKKKQTSFWL